MRITSSVLSFILFSGSTLALSVNAAELHPVTGEALAEDQTFTYRLLDEPSSLDPQIAQDVAASDIIRDLFEGLLNQDANGNLEPGVALGFEANDALDVYTFRLRRDAKWSNGDPVTAGDFVYAWRRAVDPALASPYAWYIELMAVENASEIISGTVPPHALGITAVDDHTLEVRLSASLPYFPMMTVHATTFPTHRATIEAHGDEWTRPENMVSNGAYILTEHRPNERSARERNHMYWNDTATIIERVVALVINDDNVALTRYLAGELDRGPVPTGQYPRLKEEYPDEAFSLPRLCTYYYWFNMSPSGPEAFKDARVRRALSLAADRKIITDDILAGGQIEAYNFTPGAVAGFEPPALAAASMTQSERDARAKELLTAAGFSSDNPLRFELLYNTSEGHKKIAVALSQMWKQKLGAEVRLANIEWKVFLENIRNQHFEMARSGWCGDYNEASTFLDLVDSGSAYNSGRYVNSRIDELLDAAKRNPSPRLLYEEVEKIIEEEAPIIPIYHYTSVFMLDSDVRNWPLNNVEGKWYSRSLYKVDEQ